MKTKTFDAVAMKREGQRRIYEELRGLSPEQQRAYWEQADRELLERQAAARRKVEGANPTDTRERA